MIRRVVLSALVLATLGGAGSALAATPDGSSDGRHQICVMGSDSATGPTEGICVWIPTN